MDRSGAALERPKDYPECSSGDPEQAKEALDFANEAFEHLRLFKFRVSSRPFGHLSTKRHLGVSDGVNLDKKF